MPRIPARLAPLGPTCLVLALTVSLAGCGDNPATGQAPPKNRTEGLQRLQDANIKHDQEAPANQRSGATTKKK